MSDNFEQGNDSIMSDTYDEQTQGLTVSQYGQVLPMSSPSGLSKSEISAQRFADVKTKLSKRQKVTLTPQQINLPPASPSIKQESDMKVQPYVPSSDDQTSISSKIAFNRNKFVQQSEQRKTEHSQLMLDLKTSKFEDIFEQLRAWERQQEKFKKEAHNRRQQEINEETATFLDLVCKEITSTQNTMLQQHQKVINELNHIVTSTSELFQWHFKHTTDNFNAQVHKQSNMSKKVLDIEQAFDFNSQTLDLLFNAIETCPSVEELTKLNNQVLDAQQKVLNYISSELQVVDEHLQLKDKQYSQIPKLVEQYVANIIPQYLAQYQPDLRQNLYIKSLEEKISFLLSQLQQMEQKLNFSYFAANLLIQQDQYIKQGLQDSSQKQNSMLDLMNITNKILQQNVSDPKVSKHIETNFKDSVMSLNLEKQKPYDLPQVDKLPEFFNQEQINERESADCIAKDDKQSYQQNVDEFFRRFPTKTFLFSIENGPLDNQQSTTPQEPQQGTSQSTPQETTGTINNPLFRLPKLKHGDITNIASRTRDEPTFVPKRESQPSGNTSIPRINISSQPSLPRPRPETFDLNTLFSSQPGVNTGGQIYGSRSTNPNIDLAKLYASFNFREKFTRQMHPQMFILQFETAAQQCQLTPQQMAYQFMFCLQNEFFDWYKVQVQDCQYNLNWDDLKQSFIETFSHDDEDVRDDLNLMFQEYGETPYSYLQRLRSKTILSNLTDADVKTQFVNGLKSQEAKNYLNYMKQFAKVTFKRHTSTTLLQQLEKQARLQRFSLVVNRLNWKPQFSKGNFKQVPKYVPNKSTPTKPTTKKVNFADEQSPDTQVSQESEHPQNLPDHDQFDIEQYEKQQFQQLVQNEITNVVTDAEFQTKLASIYANFQDYSDQPSAQTNTIIDSTYNIVDSNTLQPPTTSIEAGENAHVQAMFRKGQKNSHAYTDKLVEFAKKGKELQKLDVGQSKKFQYMHLPEQQLLVEAPTQFLQYVKYFQDCLEDKNNLLKCQPVLRSFNKFQEQLQVRFTELQTDDVENDDISQVNLIDNANYMDHVGYIECIVPINYLLYIEIKIFNIPISALLDTGSTVTVVSRSFMKRNNLSSSDSETSRPVTLANGSSVQMKEWKDVIIKLDGYNALKGTILISENATYDMLFGLNAIRSINASISGNKLKYSFIDQNKKTRFGTILILTKQAK